MRLVCTGVVIFAAMLGGGCGAGSKTPTAGDPKALDQLKGTWRVTAIEAGGKSVATDRVQKIGLEYRFEGDKVTIHRPDRPDDTSTVSVDATANPKKMTINQSPPVQAVYSVDGNKLQLCIIVDENPKAGYPTELASKASPKTDLLTLERR